MHLEGLTREEILKVEVPTGKPRVYNLTNDLKVENVAFLEA